MMKIGPNKQLNSGKFWKWDSSKENLITTWFSFKFSYSFNFFYKKSIWIESLCTDIEVNYLKNLLNNNLNENVNPLTLDELIVIFLKTKFNFGFSFRNIVKFQFQKGMGRDWYWRGIEFKYKWRRRRGRHSQVCIDK